jgi:hypothetical protein
MDKKRKIFVQLALIAFGFTTYGVATYLIVKVLLSLNTVPPQPKKLPEARAVGSGQAWLSSHCAAPRVGVRRFVLITDPMRVFK